MSRSWTDSGTTYSDHFTSTPVGLAGRTTNTPNTPTSSQFIRDPSGTPIAERNSDGTEYYYLFDGQGNVVGLEDPGTMVGSYDYCPTGNEADLPGGTVLTQAALNNPLRQGSRVYDDNLKDYFGGNGVISEDYSGVSTQTAELRYGAVLGGAYLGGWSAEPLSLHTFDYGTAAAGVTNFLYGTYKTVVGGATIISGGVVAIATPFPANLVTGPVVGGAAVGVGVYQVLTGVARESRGLREIGQAATTPATDASPQANVERFVSGVGPFGLPKTRTLQNVLENLP